MMTVFTVAVGSLVVFMICVLLSVYIIKSQKCCFASKFGFDFYRICMMGSSRVGLVGI